MRTCPSCGQENPDGFKFCGACGASLIAETATCASCGQENPAGQAFCGQCGSATGVPVKTPAEPATTDDVADALRSFVTGAVADRLVEAGGRIPEERRLITALFADVSGFTALADRLDTESLLEVIDPVISSLSSIVGRYEGYVEKFAGDALLALFGAPVTHEDDAARALLVALEMHEELARLCQTLPHQPELTVHIGVNSGHAIARILGSEARMDYAVLGDSVILAQRLESAAPANETFVSELTVRLTEHAFEFESVGELTLKGKAEPVPAWRLVGKRQVQTRAASERLIGREPELAELETALAFEAVGGAAVAIVGEPGVGKSRLTEAVRAASAGSGVRWLETRCLSYGAGLAYWPFVELLRTAGADTSDPYFARLLGGTDDGDGVDMEPEAFRRGLHAAFRSWLGRIAQDGPTVVAIEDLHWADASSLALLSELVDLSRTALLAFYFVARPEALEQLRALTSRASAGAIVELRPLDEQSVDALIHSFLGASGPPELGEFVAARSNGNPLFVRELVRSLRDSGNLRRDDGVWRMSPGWDAQEVPPTIEEVVAARIDLLPRASASVLATASVIGRRIDVTLLRAVLDDARGLDTSLDTLVAGGFLDRVHGDADERLVFHHALVQDVAYSRLLRRRQRDIHRQVAEIAEGIYGAGDDVIDLLARHLYLGDAGAKAVEYLRRAGERSRRLFANDEAILHYSRAAELAPDDAILQLELADLHELVGNYAEALPLYRSVRDATGDVRAWRGEASTLRKRGEYVAALATIAEALTSDSLTIEDPTPLWLEQGWTLSVAGRFGEAIEVLSAGLEAARLREDSIAGELLFQLARAETVEGRYAEAIEHAMEAQRILEQKEDLRRLATALRIRGDAHRGLGHYDDAAAALRQGLELAERVGNAEEIGGCLVNLGIVERERGDFDASISCYRRAIHEFERIDHGAGRTQATANLAHTLAESGAYEEALNECEKALVLARSIGHALAIADVTDTIASIHLGKGEYAHAAQRGEEAAGLYLDLGAAPQAAGSLRLAAQAAEHAGDEARARSIRERASTLVPAVG